MPRSQRRFYTSSIFSAPGTSLELSLRESHHLARVLRLKAGDLCQLFNQEGWGAEAEVEIISKSMGVRVKLRKVFPLPQPFRFYLKVAQALPQKRKMDDLVEKAEELGVHELWAVETERSVVKMKKEARGRVRDRWERILTASAKQSKNPVLTQVEGPCSFEEIFETAMDRKDEGFLFHPDPDGLPFSEWVRGLHPDRVSKAAPSFFLFFGPEGGFTQKEICLAESHGVKKIYLGPSTLRVETAFTGVIGALRFLL